jgi:hypothetical protein
MTEHEFSEAFIAVVDLTEKHGAHNLAARPGCAELQVDENWWIALNGHREPIECSKGLEVPPFHCGVFWREWPLGFVHPYGGEMLLHPEATEDRFIEDVRAAARS